MNWWKISIPMRKKWLLIFRVWKQVQVRLNYQQNSQFYNEFIENISSYLLMEHAVLPNGPCVASAAQWSMRCQCCPMEHAFSAAQWSMRSVLPNGACVVSDAQWSMRCQCCPMEHALSVLPHLRIFEIITWIRMNFWLKIKEFYISSPLKIKRCNNIHPYFLSSSSFSKLQYNYLDFYLICCSCATERKKICYVYS